jgi:pimeloyl-ACP methyl ester carboxylesterase
MATFVLVHGGWHGGWCWRHVTPLLRARGHEVLTPTLSGLGERAHLLEPLGDRVNLDLHVQDVQRLLDYEDLHEVVLVGHSSAGMVVAGAANRATNRLVSVVYLDAFVPEDGQALFDILLPERRAMYEQAARERGDGWLVPPPPPQAWGVTDPTQAEWLAARLTPQPLATFTQPVHLANAQAVAALPHTYVHCTVGPVAPSFAPFAARLRAAPGWRYAELATGHDAMVTMPNELAEALVAAVPERIPS